MPRVLHLGVGNFHRAHQAVYTADAGGGWAVTGVAMRNAALHDALKDGAGYDLGIRGADGLTVRRIAVHDRLILASADPGAVIDAFADPDLHVVTLTITEKGYGLDAAGALDLAHPAIAADLAGPVPTGAMGLLAHGLARRAAAGRGPLTVLSCDNLSGNGRALGAAMARFAGAADLTHDPGNRYPDTMVDRITPATSDALAAEIAARTGGTARAPVMTEAFSEWVIEDAFAGPRPDWEAAGATLAADVAPFEQRKLRLLNAAHSFLAYAGQMAGHTHVHEAMADPALRAGVMRLWDEGAVTLPAPVRETAPAYRDALAARFAVPEMRHELAQIAMDGSLKLRERIVPILRADGPAPQAWEAVAAWIAFALHRHRAGQPLADGDAARIARAIDAADGIPATVTALAAVLGLDDLTDARRATLAASVGAWLAR